MSAATQTKIFGFRLGVDPKWIVAGLLVLAALLYWYSSRGDEETGPSSGAAASRADVPATASTLPGGRARVRRRAVSNDNGALRIRDIDATHGDVDPTLRLELISRLQNLKQPPVGRSLFEIGPAAQGPLGPNGMPAVAKGPIIPVMRQQTRLPPGGMDLSVNIPFKFYGFVRPAAQGESNRGLFLENDNVLVASEGEVLDNHFLVVELTPNSARIEDTNVKQGRTIQLVPETVQQ